MLKNDTSHSTLVSSYEFFPFSITRIELINGRVQNVDNQTYLLIHTAKTILLLNYINNFLGVDLNDKSQFR